jgi:sigma-B regulation protein RsbU (phosphoserine phosphatase)
VSEPVVSEDAADRDRWEVAAELANLGTWEYDVAADRMTWDAQASRLLGLREGARTGPITEFAASVPDDDAAALRAALAEARQRAEPFDLMHRVWSAEHQQRWVEQVARPLADDTGHISRIVGAVLDVTDRVEWSGRLSDALDNEREARERSEKTVAEIRKVSETLQKSLLPEALPRVPGAELATLYQASNAAGTTAVGGDFYDVFPIGRDDWGIIIGDVCGKGAEAAVLTARIRHGVRALAPSSRRTDQVVAAVSATLATENLGNRFCTLVYARLTPLVNGVDIRLTRAGHPAPIVVRADGQVEETGVPGPIVGLDQLRGWTERRLRLGLGDSITLFTDGVTELRSNDGELFGEQRLGDVLAQQPRGTSAGTMIRTLERTLLDFQSDPRDDIAVMLLRVPGLTNGTA